MQYSYVVASLVSVVFWASLAQAQEPVADTPAQTKPGYMLVIGNGVDPALMGDYAKAAVPLLLKYRGRLLFATEEGETQVIEGGPFPGSVRVFEFPSLQSAKDFYYSEEYQKAIPLRIGNGKIDVIVADSFTPDPKWFQ